MAKQVCSVGTKVDRFVIACIIMITELHPVVADIQSLFIVVLVILGSFWVSGFLFLIYNILFFIIISTFYLLIEDEKYEMKSLGTSHIFHLLLVFQYLFFYFMILFILALF